MRSIVYACALVAAMAPGAFAQTVAGDCARSRRVRCPTPLEIVASANDAARQRPSRETFTAARQIYAYAPGALYELYTSPTHVSVILLEPGEAVTAIAAGDTSRWMVTEVEAEAQEDPRAVVLVKPHAVGLSTNIVIVTDRRTYLVEARAGGGDRYSAEIAWTYPAGREFTATPSLDHISRDYRVRTVRGARPRWLPTQVFDDGQRTWIEFPADIAAADMPPLFVMTPEGAELANYRVVGRQMMIDRVFDRAELRLGVQAPIIVRIQRGEEPAPPRRRRSGARP